MVGAQLLAGARARWPKDDLEYLRLAATTLLALVVLPLVVWKLLTDPLDAADRALGSIARR